MDGGLTSSNYDLFCKNQREMKRHEHIKTSKMSKKELLTAILAELKYQSALMKAQCMNDGIDIQAITPPPGEPPQDPPEGD